MSPILEIYGICLCTAILIFFFLPALLRVVSYRRPIHRSTTAAVQQLLNPPTLPLQTLLHSRAAANTRLLDAFRLTNTFVSADIHTHRAFVRQFLDLLRANSDWHSFANVAIQAVDLVLPVNSIPFHTFVRSVTLRTIIVGLLDSDTYMTHLDSDDIDVVAESITDLWSRSKQGDPIPECLLATLNTRLRRLIPDQDRYPNPLDFVIPTWETLWRLVAVTIGYVDANAEARSAFRALVEGPTPDKFRERLAGASPSVEDYMNEALRFHPPVRHITRHVYRRNLLTRFLPRSLAAYIPIRIIDTEIADIESAQRSALWGPLSVDNYDARRFLDAPDLAKDILAFGCGPLKCKAANWAPMAAALIVGAILSRADGEQYGVVRGDCVGGREARSWQGWSVCKVDVDAT